MKMPMIPYIVDSRKDNVETPYSVAFGTSSMVLVFAKLCPVTMDMRNISEAKQHEPPTNTPNENLDRNFENKITDPIIEYNTDAATKTNRATKTALLVSFSVSNEHANPTKRIKNN